MKFKIYWLEYHNPMNWANCPELEEEREKLYAIPFEERQFDLIDKIDKKIEQNGIKNITESLPTKTWQYDPNEADGWIEVECEDTFEANSIEGAKKIASEYSCNCEVFTVFDENDKIVFTEEDLVEV